MPVTRWVEIPGRWAWARACTGDGKARRRPWGRIHACKSIGVTSETALLEACVPFPFFRAGGPKHNARPPAGEYLTTFHFFSKFISSIRSGMPRFLHCLGALDFDGKLPLRHRSKRSEQANPPM